MKKILRLALGIMMIALLSAVSNAASKKITVSCKSKKESFAINVDITGGKQYLEAYGEKVDISFSEDAIIISSEMGIEEFNFKNKKIYLNNDETGHICDFKNIELIKQALLNQNKEPVSTSVQQRLQALEERMDRVESSMKK